VEAKHFENSLMKIIEKRGKTKKKASEAPISETKVNPDKKNKIVKITEITQPLLGTFVRKKN